MNLILSQEIIGLQSQLSKTEKKKKLKIKILLNQNSILAKHLAVSGASGTSGAVLPWCGCDPETDKRFKTNRHSKAKPEMKIKN